ncbi:MAG: GTPase HflX [Pseudomonadota bacterium]|nr:GTPase HflX [Pseudomonadota bacterium]
MNAVLVGLDMGVSARYADVDELRELAASAGLNPVGQISGKRLKPDAATFAGSGKVQEIATAVEANNARFVLFNHDISAAQERNLERALGVRGIDRTALILEIFAQRAKSFEGKMQVELAQLERQSTRLIRGWTHLERQRGGIGVRGGPGETQLEIDRRLLSDRIKKLKDKLKRLKGQRGLQRGARQRNRVFNISIVGYTNAGKSTLFNRLVRGNSYVADQLFATLDTTTRKIYLGGDQHAVVSDTVGFIRDLPHTLVAAFRATLEETVHADLLLHVVDAANPRRDEQIDDVNAVLSEIGAHEIPQLFVWNKIDLALPLEAGLTRDEYGNIRTVRISALTGYGLETLRSAVLEIALHGQADFVGSADSVRADAAPIGQA